MTKVGSELKCEGRVVNREISIEESVVVVGV